MAAQKAIGRRPILAAGVGVFVLHWTRARAGDDELTVLAASTLRAAMDRIAWRFLAERQVSIRAVYAPGPILVSAMAAGMRADIFFSAEPDDMDAAVNAGLVRSATRVDLLSSHLVLIAPTLCRHRGTPLLRRKSLSQKNFRRFTAPMHSSRLRDAG